MNYHLKLTILLLLFPAGTIMAQQTVSLQQAIAHALKNRAAVQSSKMAMEEAQWHLKSQKTNRLPDIQASASVRRNLVIPSTPVPAALFQGQAGSDQLTYLKFGTDWQSNLGVTLKYDLFNPANRRKIMEQKSRQRMAHLDYSGKKESVSLAVSRAYAEAVLANEQLRYAVEDTFLNHTELKVAQKRFSDGRLNVNELNSSRLHLNQSRSRYNNARAIARQAAIELAFQMGVADSSVLPAPRDSLPSLLTQFNIPDSQMHSASLGYRKLKSQNMLDSMIIGNISRQMLPTISLNAAYGTDYYRNNFAPFNSDNWLGNSYVSLSLKLPITNELSLHREKMAQQLAYQEGQYNLQDYDHRRTADIQKTLLDIDNHQSDLTLKSNDIELARKNLKAAEALFASGRSLPDDLESVRMEYEKSKLAYLQSAYDYIIAQLKLKQLLQN